MKAVGEGVIRTENCLQVSEEEPTGGESHGFRFGLEMTRL